jgi:hypothetical protein
VGELPESDFRRSAARLLCRRCAKEKKEGKTFNLSAQPNYSQQDKETKDKIPVIERKPKRPDLVSETPQR